MKINWMVRRIKAFWKLRHTYATTPGFLLAFWDKILNVNPRWPLPGRGRPYTLRLAGMPRPFSLRRGTSDLLILLEVFANCEYAPVVARLGGECRTVVDLGANAGFSLRLWAEAFPACRVYAAELDADNIAACRRNIGLGGIGTRVVVAQACLLGTKRPVFIDRSFDKCGLRATDRHGDEAPIMGTTMEEFLTDCGVPEQIDLLKCDIEGGESDIFKNCAGWIRRCRFMVAEVHAPYSVLEMIDDICRAGAHIRNYQCEGKNSELTLVIVEFGEDTGVA